MSVINRVISGLLGGAIGGALVGFVEAAVVTLTGGATEYWAFLFGTVVYAVFGAVIGSGWGVLASMLLRSRSDVWVMGSAGGVACSLLALVVSRFRIIRDLFAESLAIASPVGIAVHVGIVVGAVLILVVLSRSLSSAAARNGTAATAIRWLGTTVGLAVVLAAGLTIMIGGDARATSQTGSTAKGPSAILVIADTLRADHMAAYGATDVETPALDRLAADGIVFENAFANSSWTRPSIATILTSLYPASHSVMHKTDLLPDAVETLAEVMRAGGYPTAGFVTNINVAPSFNFEQGFDSYRYLAPDFFFGATDSGSKLALYGGMRLVRERFLSKKKWVENYYQDAHTVNDSSLPWLGDQSEQPFFALIHYMDPHDPYFEIPYNGHGVARVDTPNPGPSRAGELRDLYVSNVEYMDGFMAALIDRLEAAGVYDDTVIVFTSDHGEEFYEHGGWWHGTTLYEEQIHVPLIVKLPGGTRAGTRSDTLAGLVDVMPTLLSAVGLECPAACQGRDLLGSGPQAKAVYAEEDHEGNVLESVRTNDWKLVVANEGNPRGLAPAELYNLADDPKERKNLAATAPDRVAALQVDLETLRQIAAAGAVSGVAGELDDAAKERLRALGYIQ